MVPLWTLEVLDEAAERGLINDLPERLAVLEHQTPFYVGEKARQVINEMVTERPPAEADPGA